MCSAILLSDHTTLVATPINAHQKLEDVPILCSTERDLGLLTQVPNCKGVSNLKSSLTIIQ